MSLFHVHLQLRWVQINLRNDHGRILIIYDVKIEAEIPNKHNT